MALWVGRTRLGKIPTFHIALSRELDERVTASHPEYPQIDVKSAFICSPMMSSKSQRV